MTLCVMNVETPPCVFLFLSFWKEVTLLFYGTDSNEKIVINEQLIRTVISVFIGEEKSG